ncbi:SH3 domain-containing protein [Acidobacteria bacterium AH-259-D05]|nr:SH3 domain-containing protein [Acidobacteria bacterium AH-259-D05]
MQSPVLTVLNKGQEIPLFEHVAGWYRTSHEGREGFVSERYIRLVKDSVRLKPEHEHILDAAGWLDYVVGNLDALRYEDCSAFIVNNENAAAYATVHSGVRWAVVATQGYNELQIARNLVHEAAHLETWARTGKLGSQEYSRSKEKDFLVYYRRFLRQTGRVTEIVEIDSQLSSLENDMTIEHPREVSIVINK